MFIFIMILFLESALMRGGRGGKGRGKGKGGRKHRVGAVISPVQSQETVNEILKKELKELCEKYNELNNEKLIIGDRLIDTEYSTKCNTSFYYPYKDKHYQKIENCTETMKGLVKFYEDLYYQSEVFNNNLVELFDTRTNLEHECITITLYDKSTNCDVNLYHFYLMIDIESFKEETKSSDIDSIYDEFLEKILNNYELYIQDIMNLNNIRSEDLGMKVDLYDKSYKQKLKYNGLLLDVRIKRIIFDHLIEIDRILEAYTIPQNLNKLYSKKEEIIVMNKKSINKFVKEAKDLASCPNVDFEGLQIEESGFITTESPDYTLTTLDDAVTGECSVNENEISKFNFEFLNNNTNVFQKQEALMNIAHCKPMTLDTTNAILISFGIFFFLITSISIAVCCCPKFIEWIKKKRALDLTIRNEINSI